MDGEDRTETSVKRRKRFISARKRLVSSLAIASVRTYTNILYNIYLYDAVYVYVYMTDCDRLMKTKFNRPVFVYGGMYLQN